jgi:LysR family transcriptional activator of nhaA
VGEQVADYAQEIFAKGRELVEMVRGSSAGRPVELRVGIRDIMPKLVAFQLLQPAFEQAEPVRVTCLEGDMPALVSDLAIHKLDLILSDAPLDTVYKVHAYSHLLGEADVVIVGTKPLLKKYHSGFPASLEGAPFLLPTADTVLRRSLDQWFNDLAITPQIRAEFADSAMLKIAGAEGLGLFAASAFILEELNSMYGLHALGTVSNVREKYYAISVERKLKHPAVIAIREQARLHSPA